MPCVEVADAIVQTGRETLEKVSVLERARETSADLTCRQALETIHANKEWGAKVVYGDTDSLFVYLPGKTKEDAFRIGNEMADTVTSMNPRPMKLKFEKVSRRLGARGRAGLTLNFAVGVSTLRPRRQEALRRLQV